MRIFPKSTGEVIFCMSEQFTKIRGSKPRPNHYLWFHKIWNQTKPNHENLGTKPNWRRKTQFDSVWNHSFYELWHHSQHNHNLHKDQAIIIILQTKLFKWLLTSSSHTCRQRVNNLMSRNRILTNIFFAPPLQKSFSRG